MSTAPKSVNWCWCGEKHREGYITEGGECHRAARELCLYPGCENVRKKGDYCFQHATLQLPAPALRDGR
jgi:hypothetical protein